MYWKHVAVVCSVESRVFLCRNLGATALGKAEYYYNRSRIRSKQRYSPIKGVRAHSVLIGHWVFDLCWWSEGSGELLYLDRRGEVELQIYPVFLLKVPVAASRLEDVKKSSGRQAERNKTHLRCGTAVCDKSPTWSLGVWRTTVETIFVWYRSWTHAAGNDRDQNVVMTVFSTAEHSGDYEIARSETWFSCC